MPATTTMMMLMLTTMMKRKDDDDLEGDGFRVHDAGDVDDGQSFALRLRHLGVLTAVARAHAGHPALIQLVA